MSLRKTAISGIKWSSFSFVSKRALALLTNIVLARLLSPNDFGLVAMASVTLGFIDLFKDLGTGSAVIQRKDVSEGLLSSIFWINAGFGVMVSAGLYILSPAIGAFYREPDMAPLMQVLSLSFFISALSIVQSCLLTREMAFDRLAKLDLITGIFSSSVAIGAAWAGFGVMSLVYQPLLNSVLMLVLLWGTSTWHPKWMFHWGEVREVAGYSLNLAGFNIVNYFARNADNLLIGRYLGAQDLGYYDLAYRLMLYPLQGISAVVGKVLFPLYSKMQDDHERFRRTYLTAVGAIALLSFPLMLGLMAVSSPFVLVLFGEQWQPVAPLLMIFAPIGAIQSINTTTGSIYQATGRTDWMLYAGTGFSL
ncbi:partial Lipopolysaccharide biosynthesis protein WzxC, partial [Methylococcales bacterium]